MGDAIGADGVVLHPGSTRRRAARRGAGARRRGAPARADETDGCRAAARGHRGRRQHARARLRGAARADRAGRRRQAARHLPGLLPPARLGLRRARRADKLAEVVDELRRDRRARPAALPARERLARRRSARTATATRRSATASSARAGCGAFLSEPRFEKLPVLFEGPGVEGKAPAKADMDRMRQLRRTGCGRASGAASGSLRAS